MFTLLYIGVATLKCLHQLFINFCDISIHVDIDSLPLLVYQGIYIYTRSLLVYLNAYMSDLIRQLACIMQQQDIVHDPF